METGDGLTLESMLSTGGMEEQLVEQLELHHAIRSLPDTERQVIALRFFKGMTQSTVARIVGVSQVQVSRMEKRAIAKLRDMLDT
jgi:RNA polymerase sporulation-specific sigma factor